ncbi:RHS repeat domain-containing protein [Streptomyces scopuliridis]|uniref:RHS repeat domain-containing protein n=1 Tax=Streptomyces scopuliridis TaxID=452529 RepID=UPI003686803F
MGCVFGGVGVLVPAYTQHLNARAWTGPLLAAISTGGVIGGLLHPLLTRRATSIDDSLTGRRTFTLDAASRVREVHAHGWSENYAYNAAGDQTHTALAARAPGQTAAGERHYDGTRITRAERTHYSYDEQGRVTLRRTTTLSGRALIWHFQWDTEDRLTHVRTPQGVHWRYLYDPLGRRLAKQRLAPDGQVAETTTYRWDGALPAEERTGGATLVWDYAGLQPLCRREFKFDHEQHETDRRFFAIVTDLVGAPTELVSADGFLAWRARSTVWGATQWNKDSIAYTPLRYPGQYFDPETGLHYNFSRSSPGTCLTRAPTHGTRSTHRATNRTWGRPAGTCWPDNLAVPETTKKICSPSRRTRRTPR